ncbi:MAG: hypothetical protein ACK5P7_12470 [Bdellovibrio sp.]
MKDHISVLIQTPCSCYADAKDRSEEIDRLLGFECARVEVEVRTGAHNQSNWSHLSEQAFQTPYPELFQILKCFESSTKPAKWVDFGCGYGRLGLILDWYRPLDRWIGYEFIEARVREGNRVLSHWCEGRPQIMNVDLNSEFEIPEFDVGFIFDFGTAAEISAFLKRLRGRAIQRPISLIGRGRATRHLISNEHPWLSQVEEPLQTEHWTLYRSGTASLGGAT